VEHNGTAFISLQQPGEPQCVATQKDGQYDENRNL